MCLGTSPASLPSRGGSGGLHRAPSLSSLSFAPFAPLRELAVRPAVTVAARRCLPPSLWRHRCSWLAVQLGHSAWRATGGPAAVASAPACARAGARGSSEAPSLTAHLLLLHGGHLVAVVGAHPGVGGWSSSIPPPPLMALVATTARPSWGRRPWRQQRCCFRGLVPDPVLPVATDISGSSAGGGGWCRLRHVAGGRAQRKVDGVRHVVWSAGVADAASAACVAGASTPHGEASAGCLAATTMLTVWDSASRPMSVLWVPWAKA
jgi:hypothetical protein